MSAAFPDVFADFQFVIDLDEEPVLACDKCPWDHTLYGETLVSMMGQASEHRLWECKPKHL